MTRKECLEQAMGCVLRDRNNAYGGPEDCFGVIANFWSVYLGRKVYPADVAMMMSLLKIARIKANKGYADGYIDLAGYAACGAECASGKPASAPKAEGGCCQNGNDKPEFKRGDSLLVTMPDGEDIRCIYVGESMHPGCCCVRYLSGGNSGDTDDTVPLEALRRPPETESGCCQNGNDHSPEASAEPEFKSGDKVEVQMVPDSSTCASAVITAVYRDKDTCEWRYCVDFEDGWAHLVVPSARVRPVAAPKAEGCEALVEKDAPLCGERCEEFIPGLGTCENCRHAREQDAPQTPEEVCRRIVDSNPATYGRPHNPTGEELAEEEKRG